MLPKINNKYFQNVAEDELHKFAYNYLKPYFEKYFVKNISRNINQNFVWMKYSDYLKWNFDISIIRPPFDINKISKYPEDVYEIYLSSDELKKDTNYIRIDIPLNIYQIPELNDIKISAYPIMKDLKTYIQETLLSSTSSDKFIDLFKKLYYDNEPDVVWDLTKEKSLSKKNVLIKFKSVIDWKSYKPFEQLCNVCNYRCSLTKYKDYWEYLVEPSFSDLANDIVKKYNGECYNVTSRNVFDKISKSKAFITKYDFDHNDEFRTYLFVGNFDKIKSNIISYANMRNQVRKSKNLPYQGDNDTNLILKIDCSSLKGIDFYCDTAFENNPAIYCKQNIPFEFVKEFAKIESNRKDINKI